MEVLKSLNISMDKIVDLLLRTKNEDRFIEIGKENTTVVGYISMQTVKQLKLYKVLTLMDRV